MRAILILTLLLGACSAPRASAPRASAPQASAPRASAPQTSPARPSPTATPEEVATLIAAGDIASCDGQGDSATAALIEGLKGTVAALGDLVYPAGSQETYADCYDPTWGGFKDRTRPAMGNHDMQDDGGAAYSDYFGDAAGTPGEGWYSYDLGAWHVVVLNSNCDLVGCEQGSAQLDWLTNDLAQDHSRCTLAYWHHPRFSSGPHGDQPQVAPLWDALAEADADLVLDGHDHLYQRFAPQDGGVREFTVGTGGESLYRAERDEPSSELIIDDSFGVLALTLHPDSYDWSFVEADATEADSGSDVCH